MTTPSRLKDHSRPPHFLPPELLSFIFRFVSEADNPASTWVRPYRNRDLAACSLASVVWNASVYPVLYGDLRLLWRCRPAQLLLETFALNPALLSLVRRLSVEFLSEQRLFVE